MAFVNVSFGERRVKLRESSLTLRNLSLVFKLEETSIYLTSVEDEVVVADENGMFQANPSINYVLHGDPAVQHSANANVQQTTRVPGFVPRSRLNPPPMARPRFSGPSSSTSINAANITRKSNTWKKAFVYIHVDENHTVQEKCQLHLPLSEETAGVDAIKTLLKEQVGSDVEILDSKFLPIVESELTKGSQFWKSARKVHVINKNELKFLAKKDVKGKSGVSPLLAEIRKFFSTCSSPPPAPVTKSPKEELEEIMKCTICMGTSPLPCACCSKCYAIIGCIPCVEQWNATPGSSAICTLCRTSAPYKTVPIIRGISTILGQEVENNTADDHNDRETDHDSDDDLPPVDFL